MCVSVANEYQAHHTFTVRAQGSDPDPSGIRSGPDAASSARAMASIAETAGHFVISASVAGKRRRAHASATTSTCGAACFMRVLSHFSCPAVSPSHADTVSSRSLSRTACADSPTSVQERSFRTFPAVNAPNLIGSLSTSLMPQRRVSVASSLAPRQVQVLEVAGIGHEVVGATDETAKESVVGGDPSSSWVRFHLLGVPVGVLASPTLRRSLLVAFIPRAPSHHVDRG
jgi:hypothetical protein